MQTAWTLSDDYFERDDAAARWPHGKQTVFESFEWMRAAANSRLPGRPIVLRRRCDGGDAIVALRDFGGGVFGLLASQRTDRSRVIFAPPNADWTWLLEDALNELDAKQIVFRNLRLDQFAVLAGSSWCEATIMPCPTLQLLGSWQERITRKLRYEIRHDRRQLAAADFALASRVNATRTDIAHFVALNREWSALAGKPSLSDGEGTESFVIDAIAGLPPARVEISELSVGGETASQLMLFRSQGRVEYFAAAHKPTLERHSVGTVHIMERLEKLSADALEFDFLRGAERYKYRFGASDGRAVAFGTVERQCAQWQIA